MLKKSVTNIILVRYNLRTQCKLSISIKSTNNMNIYTFNQIFQLKLKTLSNLTTENIIIHSRL